MLKKVILLVFVVLTVITHSQNTRFNFPPIYKNVFSYDLLGPTYSRTTVSYERLISNGKFGVEIPFSNGYYASDIDDFEIDWSIGIEFKHYLSPKAKVSYFFGILSETGEIEQRERVHFPNPFEHTKYDLAQYMAAFGRFGAIYYPVKFLGVSGTFGYGIIKIKEVNYFPAGMFELSAHLRI